MSERRRDRNEAAERMAKELEKFERQPSAEQEPRVETKAEHQRTQAERAAEQQERRHQAERAERTAVEEADSAERHRPVEPHEAHHDDPTEGVNTAERRDAAFKEVMSNVQKDMSPAERTFSKVIHAKPVEAVSQAVGSTVARPNAILAGSLAAFIVTSAVYVIARIYGYPLSGTEMLLALVVGWLLGLIIDYARVTLAGRRPSDLS